MGDYNAEMKRMVEPTDSVKLTPSRIIEMVVGSRLTPKLFLYMMITAMPVAISCLSIMQTSYAGHTPYKNWKCVESSERCLNRTLSAELPDAPPDYSSRTLCGREAGQTQLEHETDFIWDIGGRTSYAVDWNLYCDREYLATLINSIHFVGAFIGLFIGGICFDRFGRKVTSLVGLIIGVITMFVASGSQNLPMFMAARTVQGGAMFIQTTGFYVLLMEFTPTRLRAVVSNVVILVWTLAYCLVAFLGWAIPSWRWLIAVCALIGTATIIPVFFLPESHLYYLVNKGDTKRSKEVLAWFVGICKADLDIDSVELDVGCQKDVGFLDTFKDFLNYRELTIQFVLQAWLWIVSGFLFYGFSFGWGKFGKNIYLSYTYASIGEILSWIVAVVFLIYLPRKISIPSFFLIGGCSFLIAIIPLNFGTDVINLEQLSCLIGNMFVGAGFAGIYLYTGELAPTIHRGKMLSICSMAARIGSFCGPQASLMFEWNKNITLAIFAAIAFSATLAALRLPETRGRPVPNIAEEVQLRRTGKMKLKSEITE